MESLHYNAAIGITMFIRVFPKKITVSTLGVSISTLKKMLQKIASFMEVSWKNDQNIFVSILWYSLDYFKLEAATNFDICHIEQNA